MLERSVTVAIETSSPSISSRQLIISASETDGFSVFKISMSSKSSPVNLLHFVPQPFSSRVNREFLKKKKKN